MKKVLAIACLLVVLTLAVAALASAQTQGNWRVYLKTDLNGLSSLGDMTVGVYSNAKDGFGADGVASDSNDARAALSSATVVGVVGVFDNKAWIRDVKSAAVPTDAKYGTPTPNKKLWTLRVGGLGSANTQIQTKLTIRLVSAGAGLPPVKTQFGVAGPVDTKYFLKMVDNKGIAGAPEAGTIWSIPVPTVYQSAAFVTIMLPTFNIGTAKDEASLINDGYQMELWQEQVVPEPSSLLALGAGLMGLAGFASRKRRS